MGVADLLRRPGSRREVVADVSSGGIRVGEVEVPTGATIHAELAVEALSDGLVVTGTVQAPWSGPCRRCLEVVEGDVAVDVREVFERTPTEGETWPLEDDHVDLAAVVRDAVVLALPLAPLCRPDCAGPDPERFPTNQRDESQQDPRWAKLDELRFDQ